MNCRLLLFVILFANGINAQIFTTTYQGANTPKKFISDGLVLQYEFDNLNCYAGSGATTVKDLKFHADGTLYGTSMTYSTTPGNIQMLRANSNYIYTNSSLSPYMINTTISLFTWVYITGNGVILTEQGQTTLNSAYHDSQIEMVGGVLKFRVWSNSTITSTITPVFNKWYYIGFTYNQATSTMNTYVNGQLSGTLTGITKTSPADLYYGIGATDFTHLGDGGYGSFKLGAFHVYNRALTGTEVLFNYNGTKEKYEYGIAMELINTPSSGSTWTDVSGNGNNATLVGSPTYVSNNGGGYTLTGTQYISTPYNLSNNFTISIVASLNPTNYWSTVWGNDNYNSSLGYFAYFSSASVLEAGSTYGISYFSVSNYSTIHFWDFVVKNNSITLYKDGVNQGSSTFNPPLGYSTNGLFFGARHTNTGSGSTDLIKGTYYNMRVYKRALTDAEIASLFNAMRSTYGL